jgi:hypothetical protein
MKLRTKLTAIIVGGFVLGYLIIAFVTLEIDFRNWSEGARSGLFVAHIPLTALLCSMTWTYHDEGGEP